MPWLRGVSIAVSRGRSVTGDSESDAGLGGDAGAGAGADSDGSADSGAGAGADAGADDGGGGSVGRAGPASTAGCCAHATRGRARAMRTTNTWQPLTILACHPSRDRDLILKTTFTIV